MLRGGVSATGKLRLLLLSVAVVVVVVAGDAVAEDGRVEAEGNPRRPINDIPDSIMGPSCELDS